MLIQYTKIVDSPIIELTDHSKVGEVFDLIIDPEKLRVGAITPKNNNFFGGKLTIISGQDIDEITTREVAVLIPDPEVIMPVDELPRIKELINNKYYGIGQKVFTRSGSYIGKVFDYLVNGKNLEIHKLYIRNLFSEKIISVDNIVSFEGRKIIIKDNFARNKATMPAIQSSVV